MFKKLFATRRTNEVENKKEFDKQFEEIQKLLEESYKRLES